MKKKKCFSVLSNIFIIISFAALAIGASFHGYRIHPEHEETYKAIL